MILDRINQANDIKKLKPEEYPLLAQEIRRLMIRTVSKNGGHLASNLGVVELTMALHLVLDLPKDKLIFDVGHQCYTHKILSGRKDSFDTLRREGGISGFPKMAESDCDVFDTGHSSTSVSLGLGLAQARDRKGEDYAVVSVIGDGSLTGGMAFEALNNASHLKSNFIIVVNDNNMSIARNVGGMTHALQDLRTAPRYNRLKENVKNALDKIPNVGGRLVRGIGHAKDVVKQILLPDMFFEGLGLTYLGPVDGHDISQLIDTLQDARRVNRPVVVHVITKKGKGYRFAENDPERFHGIGPFDIRSGETAPPAKTYTDYVSQGLLKLAETDPDVVAVTAAMAAGTGLDCFRKHYSERLFDVGIAEQHAVTFAAGLAKGGLKPYVCIYSTFLQRAYDQIVHDIALQKADVTLLIDRAGIVGADGETHQGMLDGSYLQTVPGLTVMAPRDGQELLKMLAFSHHFTGPLAIRYPRGAAPDFISPHEEEITPGRAETLTGGRDAVLFAAGSMVKTALEAEKLLREDGIEATVVNARFTKPFDRELLRALGKTHPLLAVLEENDASGALGEHIAAFLEEEQLPCRFLNLALPDAFIPHGSPEKLLEKYKLDPESVADRIRKAL